MAEQQQTPVLPPRQHVNFAGRVAKIVTDFDVQLMPIDEDRGLVEKLEGDTDSIGLGIVVNLDRRGTLKQQIGSVFLNGGTILLVSHGSEHVETMQAILTQVANAFEVTPRAVTDRNALPAFTTKAPSFSAQENAKRADEPHEYNGCGD